MLSLVELSLEHACIGLEETGNLSVDEPEK